MFVDETRRKLKIPAKFVPYLEKHRIYELFHEMASELLMYQPDDHVLFMATSLRHAAMNRSARRVMIFGPPFEDISKIARKLARTLGVPFISKDEIEEILNKYSEHLHSKNKHSSDWIQCKCIQGLLRRRHDDCFKGWILIDYPKNREQAFMFQKLGILPTHAFQLIPPFESPIDEKSSTLPPDWKAYYKNLFGIRETFLSRWKEVKMNKRTNDQIIELLTKFSTFNKHCGAPMLPRLALIGSKGSGCKSVARLLVERFELIHVDFELLIKQMLLIDSIESQDLKNPLVALHRKAEIYINTLNKKLLEDECVNKGWVLTGYPTSVNEFKALDVIDTPPNRVVFIDVPKEMCRFRLVNRKFNVFTGSTTNVAITPSLDKEKTLKSHPDDAKINVEKWLKKYEDNVEAMKQYCGRTASVVNGENSIKGVFESVAAVIMKPLADNLPRDPNNMNEENPQPACPIRTQHIRH